MWSQLKEDIVQLIYLMYAYKVSPFVSPLSVAPTNRHSGSDCTLISAVI